MTNKFRIRMLCLLTVMLLICSMAYWNVYWGWEADIAASMKWLCAGLYSVGNVALIWGALLLLDRYYKRKKINYKVLETNH